MEIINWLNSNDGAVIGIATVVLVSITVCYTYLTWRLLKANDTPEISVSLRPHKAYIHCVMLCIENIGTGAARDIRFQTDLSFKPDGKRTLEEIDILKKGIDYLGPKEKTEHFLVSVISKLDKLKERPLEISVTYTDSVKLKYRHKRTFRLDFGADNNLQLSVDERMALLDELAEKFMEFAGPDVQPLSDYAVSREGIYEDHL